MSECKYCGRDSPLIVEDKWCSELCKYAREVYEKGEFVVDLDTKKLVCCIGARKRKKYRLAYSKASISSKRLCRIYSESSKGRHHSDFTKSKLSASKLGDKNPAKKCRKTLSEAHKDKKFSKKHCENISRSNTGRKHSQEHNRAISQSNKGQRNSDSSYIQAWKTKRDNGYEVKQETCEKQRVSQKNLIKKGLHHWSNERPCNNPSERALDLLFASIFRVDVNHNFKVENQDGREFQCDFLSLLLHLNVETDEPDHDKPEKQIWDKERDIYCQNAREDVFVIRFKTTRLIVDLVNVVKEIYALVNQQREKYNLVDFSVLEYDERWTTYLEQMQALLKEWFESKDKKRFKTFREKKREIDKQWLWLVEEQDKKHNSNLAVVYRETLEKNLKLNFRNVVSIFRK